MKSQKHFYKSDRVRFFIMFLKTFCFASDMKNSEFLGVFEARIKNREARKDSREKPEYVKLLGMR